MPQTILPNINIGQLITGFIGIVIIIAFIASFANLLIGGLQWIVSGGEKEKVSAAQRRILHAFIGLVVVMAAWPLFQVVQTMFGITILGGDLGALLSQIFPFSQ